MDFFSVQLNSWNPCHKLPTLSDIISIFDAFTDLFSELNHHESEKHYKMNFEKVETWQGIIISPA